MRGNRGRVVAVFATIGLALALPGPVLAEGMLTVQRVISGPAAGGVTSADGLIDCPPTCSRTAGPHTYTLTATAGPGSAFVGWTGCDSTTGAICAIHVESARDSFEDGIIVPHLNVEAVTATFAALFALTVERGGGGAGTVTSQPAGVSCGETCVAAFLIGTVVTLTAEPERGSYFRGWKGDCSGTRPCTVTLQGARRVTAMFGRTLTGERLRASPARPVAGRIFTLRLELDGDPEGLASSCRATVKGKRIRLLGKRAGADALVCHWRIPAAGRGDLFRAQLTARDGHAAVRWAFATRVR
jgi:hypothetical protein